MRFRSSSRVIGALCLGVMLAGSGCANTFKSGDGGAGASADAAGCIAGSAQCVGNVWVECVDGKQQPHDCGAGVCVEGLGCRTCAPSTDYCVEQDVFRCNADGTQETKVETCPPGQDCVLGKCTDLCDLERDDHSNVGCEFWAVDLPNEYGCQSVDGGVTCFLYTNAANQQFAVAVANTSQFEERINDFSNGASLLIPTSGIDRDHLVLGWSTANPIRFELPDRLAMMEGIPDHTNVTIVGVFPDTQVEVKVAHKIMPSPDGKIPAANAGETVSAALGPYDVLNINSEQDWGNPSGDLTGTVVTANHPVAVFSGAARILVPGGSLDSYAPRPPEPAGEYKVCCTEHMEQQMFPVTSLGTTFAVTRSPVRSTSAPEPDFYRVLASEDGTVVRTNLSDFPQFALDKGQTANFWSTTPFTVEASKPIMIAQYAVCQGFLESWKGGGGDLT